LVPPKQWAQQSILLLRSALRRELRRDEDKSTSDVRIDCDRRADTAARQSKTEEISPENDKSNFWRCEVQRSGLPRRSTLLEKQISINR
jgi:hypothetical protein